MVVIPLSFVGVEAGGGAAAKVADSIVAARGKPGDLPVGHTASVNEIEEVTSEAHARIRSSPAVRRPPKNTDWGPSSILSRNDL